MEAPLASALQNLLIGVGDKEGERGVRAELFAHEQHRGKRGVQQHRSLEHLLGRGEVLARAVARSAVAGLVVVGGVGHQVPRSDVGEVQLAAVRAGAVLREGVAEPVAVSQRIREDLGGAVVRVVALLLSGQQRVDPVVEVVEPVPLEPVAAALGGADQARVVLVGLADHGARHASVRSEVVADAGDFFHDGEGEAVVVGLHRVQAQPVSVELAEPLAHRIQDVGADLVGAGAGDVDDLAPGGEPVRQVRAERVVVVALRAEVVVHDVEEDGDAAGMRGVDKLLEPLRAAVRLMDSKPVDAVVAPVSGSGEGLQRHEFDGVDAQLGEVVQLLNHAGEGAGGGEGAHVELVNHHVLGGDAGPVVIVPREVGAHDLGRAMHALGLEARARIRHGDGPLGAVEEREGVVLTRLRGGGGGVEHPPARALRVGLHVVFLAVDGHAHLLALRGPYLKLGRGGMGRIIIGGVCAV